MGVIRASKRRSGKRLSLARSLDDLEVGTFFFFFSAFCLNQSIHISSVTKVVSKLKIINGFLVSISCIFLS